MYYRVLYIKIIFFWKKVEKRTYCYISQYLASIPVTMKIVAQTLDQTLYDVDFGSNDNPTLADLKDKVQEMSGFPVSRVVCSGAEVKGDTTLLSSVNIKEGTKVVVVLQRNKTAVEKKAPSISFQPPNANSATVTMTPSTFSVTPSNTPPVANSAPIPVQEYFGPVPTNIDFGKLISEYGAHLGQMDGDYDEGFFGDLTEEQRKDVEEIVNMGMGSYDDVLQYYIACDCNKELTVNNIMDSNF